MCDELLSVTRSRLCFIAQSAHEGDGIRVVPPSTGCQPSQPVRWPGRSLAQDDHAVSHAYVEPVARLDPEFTARFARHDDLVLGTDLDAKHDR
jgi:hypothetical protein